MAYARFGWGGSDVYIYQSCPLPPTWPDDFFCCQACSLNPSTRPENLIGFDSTNVATASEMIAHLEEHRAAGHCVPDDAFDKLLADSMLAASPVPQADKEKR